MSLIRLMKGHQLEFKRDYSPQFTPASTRHRIVVILLDSTPYKKFFSAKMSFITSLKSSSAWGISRVNSTPFSMAGDHAIFAGQLSNFLTIFEDFSGKPSAYDNVFRRVTDSGKRAVIVSSHCLSGAYKQDTDKTAYKRRHFSFRDFRTDAQYHYESAIELMQKGDWDFLAIQFVSLDFAGHLYTPQSAEYDKMLSIMDGYLKDIINEMTSKDYLLITSEHGMDDSGFHVDLSKDIVETPFILKGPGISVGGPVTVSQIDWAPTLSILAGVHPVYPSPAVPILPLMELTERQSAQLLNDFSKHFDLEKPVKDYPQLIETRKTLLINRLPKIYLYSIVTMTTFFLIGIFRISNIIRLEKRHFLIFLPCLLLVGSALIYLRNDIITILDLSKSAPFSANFIMQQPVKSLLICVSIFMSVAFLFFISEFLHEKQKGHFIFLVSQIGLVMVYLASNPYHLLNWLLLFLPIALWFFTQQKRWLTVSALFVIALLIRRISYYDFSIPDRWIIMSGLLLTSMIYRLIRREFYKAPALEIFCIPIIIVRGVWEDVYSAAFISVLILIVLLFRPRSDHRSYRYGLALWTTIFYLAVSGNIFHLTHIVALPLFLTLWNISDKSDGFIDGYLPILAVWFLFFISGNTISLKLSELSDTFILKSASGNEIIFIVLIIAARYLLPLLLFFNGLYLTNKGPRRSHNYAAIYTAPIVAVSIELYTRFSQSTTSVNLEQVTKLLVLFCYILLLFLSLVVVKIGGASGKLTETGKLSSMNSIHG